MPNCLPSYEPMKISASGYKVYTKTVPKKKVTIPGAFIFPLANKLKEDEFKFRKLTT